MTHKQERTTERERGREKERGKEKTGGERKRSPKYISVNNVNNMRNFIAIECI